MLNRETRKVISMRKTINTVLVVAAFSALVGATNWAATTTATTQPRVDVTQAGCWGWFCYDPNTDPCRGGKSGVCPQ